MVEALPVDFVKINGSLIRGIDTMPRQRIIVEAIHSFCRQLGIKTIVEMVENEAEFRIVEAIGVDYTQGWYLGKAIDLNEIADA